MEQIILVCGRWSFEKNEWVFFVENSRGGRVLGANRDTSFNDFVRMVYEDFGLDPQISEVKLSYKLPRKCLSKLPVDTPPIFVGNSRQLRSFLEHFKSDAIRLCVEISAKHCKNFVREDGNGGDGKRERNEDDEDDDEDNEDDDSRFDYCDDSDGASSDDEEYGSRGGTLISDDEESEKNLPPKKRGASSIPESVKLEMRSVDLAVGQRYATKKDLEKRLEILVVAHKFDYNVGRSTPTLLTVSCWVKGCKWRVRAGTIGDSPSFHIKTYIGKHSCSVTERSTRARKATYQVLGHLYKEFIGGVGPTILPKHLADAINKRFRIQVFFIATW